MRQIISTAILMSCLINFSSCTDSARESTDAADPAPVVLDTARYGTVVDGIHVETGLAFADGFPLVLGNCISCHSAKLITQNRATREGWQEMIHWMQQSQGLGDLGKLEEPILDYLATHYAPKEAGRRANLDLEAIKWYALKEEGKR